VASTEPGPGNRARPISAETRHGGAVGQRPWRDLTEIVAQREGARAAAQPGDVRGACLGAECPPPPRVPQEDVFRRVRASGSS
jgi:hypothetical protein